MKNRLLKKISFIFVFIIALSFTNVKAASTLTYIDYPTTNGEVTDNLKVQGWVMSTTNTTLKAYVDNQEIELERVERYDVLHSITGYGNITTNPKPGFYKDVDLKFYGYGGHILKINVLDSNSNIIQSTSRTFIKTSPKTKTNIDYPTVNQSFTDNLSILGWVMSTTNTTIKAFIDNQEVAIDRVPRGDVLNAIKGYGDITTNPTPGFTKIVDIKKYSYGAHTLKINVYDSNNSLIQTTTRTFIKSAPKTQTHIDYPILNQGFTDNLRVLGWVMSTTNTTIKAYIDNQEVSIDRAPRGDVLNAIKGYGDYTTNPTPGFAKNIDITNLNYGTHTFTINVYDSNNNLIQSTNRSFVKAAPKTKTNIDYPLVNEGVTDNLRVLGWIMSTANTTIKAYIDNQEVTLDRAPRGDVLNAVKGYGDITTNPTPGFAKNIDITNLSYGTHTLRIDVLDSKNVVIQTTTRNFKRNKSKSDLCIDFPVGTEKIESSVTISGWYLKSNNYSSLRILIDNQEVNIDTFTKRFDVLNVIPGYSQVYNQNNGYTTKIDLKNYKYGLHTIKVQIIDNNGVVVNEKTRQFTRLKPASKINVDYPMPTTKKNMIISGWYLAKYNNTKVQLFVDGVEITNFTTEKRQDVLNVYPEYSSYMSNSNPGYSGSFDLSNYKDGNHTFTVKIINLDNNDVINTYTKTFKLKKYDGMINIDYPSISNINSNFTLEGWELSESPNSYLKVYIDNRLQNLNITRTARGDVLNAITVYGDASVNPTPGFTTTINIQGLSEGGHSIRVELYTYLNELIATETKNILIFTNRFNGIDISAYNSVYNWQLVKNSGIDYMFARVAVRGYGINNQGIDGNLVADAAFNSHVNGANSVGIKSGAYVFTQATTTIEAVAEANLALQKVYAIGGKSKIQLPIVYDVEFSGCYENGHRCGRADNLDKETRTTIAIAFLDTIRAAGYQPMIYASTSFLNNQLNMSRLSSYPVWVAHYGVNIPTYQGPYEVWQYTSGGTVPGINGVVDMDYFYKRY